MRLAMFTVLALLPTAVLAQSGSQANLLTAANSAAPVVHATGSTATAPAAGTPSVAIAPAVHFRDVIAATSEMNMQSVTDHMRGSVSHDFALGSRNSDEISAPRLIHVVNRTLREEDALAGKAVAVRMTVKSDGVPTDLKVVESAGPEADKDTLAAVSQYRFQPGMLNHLPTESSVTVRLRIEK